jgi:hypothetical protein
MTCPSCGRENPPAARFCGRCGTPLDPGARAPTVSAQIPIAMPTATPPAGADIAAAAWPAQPAVVETQYTNLGTVYGLGFGPTFFAIWPLQGGPAIETFERTQAGWEAAWRRFQELDRRDAVPAWRRATVGWVLLDILIGFALWFLVLIVEAAVLVAAHKQTEDLTDTSAAGVVIALPMVMAGWLVFALARNRKVRWLALIMLAGGALVVAITFGIAGQAERV